MRCAHRTVRVIANVRLATMAKFRKRVGAIAIALWAPLALSLWPLPPQQIEEFEAAMSASRSMFPMTPEIEKLQSETVEAIQNAEPELWTEWSLSLALLVVGVGSWSAYISQLRWSKWAIVVSTTLFLAYLLPNASYGHLFEHWSHGSTGLRFFPWRTVFTLLHYHFVMPIGLIVLSSLVFVRPRKGNGVGSTSLPI